MAEILSMISIIAFVLAAIFLILAVFLWFYFRIPRVIGDLSGRTARKSIERMRAHNERSGNKAYRPSATNAKRGRLTDTMPNSRKLNSDNLRKSDELDPRKPQPIGAEPAETGILQTNKAELHDPDQTEQLETATALLVPEENETALLLDPATPPMLHGKYVALQMLDQVMLIHTQEVI